MDKSDCLVVDAYDTHRVHPERTMETAAKFVFLASVATLFWLPRIFNSNEAILRSKVSGQRYSVIWMEGSLMVAGAASLLALLINTGKSKFARCCGYVAVFFFLFALVLLQSLSVP